jgi:DNA-binding FadR family transcriptional regulator
MHAVRDLLRRALLTVYQIPESPDSAVVEHRKIRDAIAAGDAARARDEMRGHLDRVEFDVHRGGGDG